MKTTLPTLIEYTLRPLLHKFSREEIDEYSIDEIKLLERIRNINLAKFLIQKLALWMFIPCNDKGEPLEPPIQMDYIPFEGHPTKYPQECYESDFKEYQQALDKRLFKGFTIEKSERGYKGIYTLFYNDKFYETVDLNKKNIWCRNPKRKLIQDLTNKVDLTDKKHKELNL